jgi:uncharacterized membrane protein YpjA
MLWSLFWINLLGTIYGYIWYGNQLQVTYLDQPLWYLPFVPDSPTASLFFTMSVLYLLVEGKFGWTNGPVSNHIRGFIEAFALITSFKYGIWAVSMILAAAQLGNQTNWQDWMLSISHLGMASEALLFARIYRFRFIHIVLVGLWSFANDYMDYARLTYPWLPEVLVHRLGAVRNYTVVLSIVSIVVALVCLPFNRKSKF